jgi:RNA polymerase sigma factor (sigma-70 family)
MSRRPIERVVQQLRQAAGDDGARPDAELLRLFVDQGDEAAFAALVRRHAAMVLGVCRRVAGDAHDAEDAFQAAFCVLLRKARSIRRREVLGSWLYGVAYRTALAARARRARTHRREHQVDAMPQPVTMPAEPERDWQPLLDAALARLPDKYRAPIVLCDLEGKSRRAAAEQLGLAEGTLSSRLARARRLLAHRLRRQGVALSGGALAALLSESTASAQVPAALVQTVASAGAQVLSGQAALAFSGSVLALAEGVMKSLLVGKLKVLTVVLLIALGVLGLGGIRLWLVHASDEPAAAPSEAPATLPGALDPSESAAQVPSAPTVPVPAQTSDPATSPRNLPPQYRVELAILVNGKPIATPSIVTTQQQRASVQVAVDAGQAGKPGLGVMTCGIDVIRLRGNEALVSFTIDQKQRQSSALVRGQSLEFEDFIALDAWKEITDPTWAGMTFKLKVNHARRLPQPPPLPKLPESPAATAKETGTELRIFRLEHSSAAEAAKVLQEAFGSSRARIVSDDRSNSLFLTADATDLAVAERILRYLDSEQAPARRETPRSDATAPMGNHAAPAAKAPAAAALALPNLPLAWSPDGQRLFVGTHNGILMLESATGKIIAKMEDVSKTVEAVAISPDGKLLASGNKEGAVRLWDAATGKQLRQLPKVATVSLEFRVDGASMTTLLIVTATDQSRHVFNLATGELVRVEKQKEN